MQNRYHLIKGTLRTTATLDATLSGLLAIKLGETPETPEAYTAVRKWLQSRLDETGDPERIRTSQWLSGEVALYIADNIVSEKYLSWLTGV